MWGMAVTEFERRHLSDACFWLERIHSLLLPEDSANQLHCSLALSQCYYEMKDYANALRFARIGNSIYGKDTKKDIDESILLPSSSTYLASSSPFTPSRLSDAGSGISTARIQSPLGDGRLHMLRALIRLRREQEALFLLETIANEGNMDSGTLCLIAMETYDENLAEVCRLALSRLLHEYLQKGPGKQSVTKEPQIMSSLAYSPLENPATRFSLINALLKLDLQSLESIFVQKFGKGVRVQLDENTPLKDTLSFPASTGSGNVTKDLTRSDADAALEVDIRMVSFVRDTMRDDEDFEKDNESSGDSESLVSLTIKVIPILSANTYKPEPASGVSHALASSAVSPIGAFGSVLEKYCESDDDTMTFDLSFLSEDDLEQLRQAISRVTAASQALLKECEKPFGTHQVCSLIGKVHEKTSEARETTDFPVFPHQNAQKISAVFLPSAEDLVEMSYCMWNAGLFAVKLNLVSRASDFFLASFTLLEDNITTQELAVFAIRCILMACSCLHKTYPREGQDVSKTMANNNEDNNVDPMLAISIEKEVPSACGILLEAREKASCVHMLVDKARHIRLASHKLVSSPTSSLPNKRSSSQSFDDPLSSTSASLSVIFNQIDLVSIIFDFRALLELGVDSPFEKIVGKFSSDALSDDTMSHPKTISSPSSPSTSALTIANPIFSVSVLDILASNAIQANRLDVAKEVIRNRLQKAVSSPLFDLSDALRMYRQLLLIEKGRENGALLRIFDEILRLVTNFNSISSVVGQDQSRHLVKAGDADMRDEEVRRKAGESKPEGKVGNADGETLDRIDIDVIISTAWNRGVLHFQSGDHSSAESFLSRAIQLRKVLIVDPFLRKQKSEHKTRPASDDNIGDNNHTGETMETISDPNPEQGERMTKAYAYLKQILHSAKTRINV